MARIPAAPREPERGALSATSAHLVQVFLPRTDNQGAALPHDLFTRVRTTLVEAFGGMTAHSRSPVKGVWVDGDAGAVADDLIIYEVVVQQLDRDWWQGFLASVRAAFRQDSLHVRVHPVELL